ncbi:MAG: hypothetical protein R3B68_11630 [Phycisphaerales bacterium]
MASHMPHCPACAAPLPEYGDDGIVTCEFCGTDSNVQRELVPRWPLRSPPLSLKGWRPKVEGHTRYSSDRLPLEGLENFCVQLANWDAGVVFTHLLTEPDPDRQFVIATTSSLPVWDKDAVAWAAALADEVSRQFREGRGSLAMAITLLLRGIAAGKNDSKALELLAALRKAQQQGPNWEEESARLVRHCFATTGYIRRREDSRTCRAMLELARVVEGCCPRSDVALVALSAAGPAAMQRLMDLAAEAREDGDEKGAALRLECLRLLLARLGDSYHDPRNAERLGLQLDAAFHLIMTRRGPEQEALVRFVADLADDHTNEPDERNPRDWPGPKEVLNPILLFTAEMLRERPALGEQMLRAIKEEYREATGGWGHMDRWKEAVGLVPTAEGRAAFVRTFHEIVGPPGGRFAMRNVIDLAAALPALPEPDPKRRSGVALARPVAGQAECPSCGRALPLKELLLVVVCGYCGGAARIARELRVVSPGVREDDLGHWSPRRLLDTYRTSDDDSLRMAIANELDSPLTDGGRFAEHADAVLEVLSGDLPGDIGYAMDRVVKRLHRHRDEGFSKALVDSFRRGRFGPHQNKRLLGAIAAAGSVALPALLDYVDANARRIKKHDEAVGTALSLARRLLDEADDAGSEDQTRWLLERMHEAGDPLAAELAEHLIHSRFRNQVFGPSQEMVVRFIDEHLDVENLEFPRWMWRGSHDKGRDDDGDRDRPARPKNETPEQRRARMLARDAANLIEEMDWWRSEHDTAESILERLAILESLRLDATRHCVMHSARSRPADMTGSQYAQVKKVLRPWRAHPKLGPIVEEVLEGLRAPGLGKRMEGMFQRLERNRTMRRLMFWR